MIDWIIWYVKSNSPIFNIQDIPVVFLSIYFLCNLTHFETKHVETKKTGPLSCTKKVTNTEDETWQLCFSCLRPWGHKGQVCWVQVSVWWVVSLQSYKKGGSLLLVSLKSTKLSEFARDLVPCSQHSRCVGGVSMWGVKRIRKRYAKVLIMRGLHLLENLPAMILFFERSSVSMIKGYGSKVECLYREFLIKIHFSPAAHGTEHVAWVVAVGALWWHLGRLPGGPRLWVLESPTLVASLNFRRQNELVQCSKRMNPVSGREWRLGIALLVFCQSDCLRGWSWKNWTATHQPNSLL